MSKSRFTLATLPLALTLTACSGGGGGGSDDKDDNDVVSGEPAATVEVERVSLTGLAIKGIARGAKIELFTLDTTNGSFQPTAFASGSTDANGNYQLDFNDGVLPSGVVKIVLSYQDGAELQCDNINPEGGDTNNACGNTPVGAFYPMPTTFRLVSIADFDSSLVDESGARVINLTALSSLAGALLEEDDDDNSLSYAQQVLKAEAQIKAILGMAASTELTADTPDNLVEEGDYGDAAYGALNAAFERIAKQRGVAVSEIIQAFISAITSDDDDNDVGQIRWKSATDNYTLDVLISAAEGFSTSADFSAIRGEIHGAEPESYTSKIPPVVSIGSNRTVAPGASVTLSASEVQGISGKNISYGWFTNAPAANLTSTTSNQTFTAPLTEGNYRVGVTVTDTDTSLASTATFTLTVKAETIIGSALDGDYHMIFSARRLEKQTDGSTAYLLRGEMEDGGTMKIGTGSEGSIVYEASDFNAENYKFETNLADSNSPVSSNIEAYTGENFQAKVAVKANGLASVDIPESVDTSEGNYYVDKAFTLRLIPIAQDNSLYLGFGVADGVEYHLVNGQADTSDILFDNREATNILLARHNGLTGTDLVKNANYSGFELEFSTAYGSIETSVHDVNFMFDENGALTSSEIHSANLSGLPGSFYMSAYPNDVGSADSVEYSFNNGRFAFDSIPEEGSAGSHGAILIAADQSALLMHSVGWENNIYDDPNNTAFTSTTDAERRSTNIGVYVKSPETAINLDGKTFSIAAQSFYSLQESQGTSGTFGIRGGYGTATFSGSTLTLTLTGKQVGVSGDGGGNHSYSKPATASTRTVEIQAVNGLTTDSSGCLNVVEALTDKGTRLCTDGKTLVIRHYSTATDANSGNSGITSNDLGLFVGTNVTP